ncbi:hypothetical protein [Paeniglutamicibacter gangotriensis]|uniref:Uncharacterized protein n=1 Tax=Paeniglutamicibacter gangotriensis Lz1y TaxID=1276920 RepID=M7MW10_9MICC|nr:hypothetical protein [Paeniglutamicibacter gangotriensis]EMQ99125.1 hypothetical protein ADIAG_01115 [Paeniglutamicibacter gangotriensis Lz1y]
MPKTSVFSLVIVRLPYAAATLVLTGTQNHQEGDPTLGYPFEFNSVGLRITATVISEFAVLPIVSVMFVELLAWRHPGLILPDRPQRNTQAHHMDRGHPFHADGPSLADQGHRAPE